MNYELSTMNAFCRGFWGRLRRAAAHAFALRAERDQLQADELALLDRLARLLADRGLATPAIFFVESLAPLGFLGGQLVHALLPIVEQVAPPEEIERLARLLERRDTPALFADRLRWFDTVLRLRSGQALRPGSGQAHHRWFDSAHHGLEEKGDRR